MFKKIASSVVIAALIVTAPGLEFYRACAQGRAVKLPAANLTVVQPPIIPAAGTQTNWPLIQTYLQRLGIIAPNPSTPKSIPAENVNVSLLEDLRDKAGLSEKTAADLKDSSDSRAKEESDEIFGLHPRTAEAQMDAVVASLKDTNTLRPSRTLMEQLSRDVKDVWKDMTVPRLKTKREIARDLRKKVREMRKHRLAQYNAYVYAGGIPNTVDLSPNLDPALDKIENLVRSVEKSSKGNRRFVEKFFPALDRTRARILSPKKENGADSSRLSAKEFSRQMGAVHGRLHVVSETNRMNLEQMTQAEVVESYKAEFSSMRTQDGRPVLREKQVPVNPKATEFGFYTVAVERLSPKMDRHLMRMEELVQEAYEKFKAEEKELRKDLRGHPDYSVDELLLDSLNTRIHGRLTDYNDNVARSLKALEKGSPQTSGLGRRGAIEVGALLAPLIWILPAIAPIGAGAMINHVFGGSAPASYLAGAVLGFMATLITRYKAGWPLNLVYSAFGVGSIAALVISALSYFGIHIPLITAATVAPAAPVLLAMAPLAMPGDSGPKKDPIQEERKILADSLGDVLNPAMQEADSPSSLIKAYLQKAEEFKATELNTIKPIWLRSAVAEILDSVGKGLSSLSAAHQDPVQFEQALVRFIQSVGKAMEEGKNVGEIVQKIREAAEKPGQSSELEQGKILISEVLQSLLVESYAMGLILPGFQRIPPLMTAQLYQQRSKQFKESEASSIQPESLRSAALSIIGSVGLAISHLAKAYPFVTHYLELQQALGDFLNKIGPVFENEKSMEEIESRFRELAQETEKTPIPAILAPEDRFGELIFDSFHSVIAWAPLPSNPNQATPRQLADSFKASTERVIAEILSRVEPQRQREALASVLGDFARAMSNMAQTHPDLEAFQKASDAFLNEVSEQVLKQGLSVEDAVQTVKSLADGTESKPGDSSRSGKIIPELALALGSLVLAAGLGYGISALLGIALIKGGLISAAYSMVVGALLSVELDLNLVGLSSRIFSIHLGNGTKAKIGKVLFLAGALYALGSLFYLAQLGWPTVSAAAVSTSAILATAPLGMPGRPDKARLNPRKETNSKIIVPDFVAPYPGFIVNFAKEVGLKQGLGVLKRLGLKRSQYGGLQKSSYTSYPSDHYRLTFGAHVYLPESRQPALINKLAQNRLVESIEIRESVYRRMGPTDTIHGRFKDLLESALGELAGDVRPVPGSTPLQTAEKLKLSVERYVSAKALQIESPKTRAAVISILRAYARGISHLAERAELGEDFWKSYGKFQAEVKSILDGDLSMEKTIQGIMKLANATALTPISLGQYAAYYLGGEVK